MAFSFIPFLLLIVPIVEIAVFILMGDTIGLFYTLLMVVVTAVLGTILLRIQGFQILTRVRNETASGRIPGRELGNGAMIIVAGILLLTPGFVTDGLGFLLFVPPVRSAIWHFVTSRVQMMNVDMSGMQHNVDPATGKKDDEPPVVDLSEDEYSASSDPTSPWKK